MPESVQNTHPDYNAWNEDETRLRATYHARRKDLVSYLVPHRFESEEFQGGTDLRRSNYGYVPRLNAQYVGELAGHIRGATARYLWGDLEEADEEVLERRAGAGESAITGRPAGGVARMMWDDVTLDGTPWPRFFAGKVLEWGLSSVGGFVLCDVPPLTGEMSARDERRQGRRPFTAWVPMSRVVDVGIGRYGFGFQFVEVLEERAARTPLGRGGDDGPAVTRLLYELDEGGRTQVTRRNEDGTAIEETIDMGVIEDDQGYPVLPLVPAFFGEHPDIPWLGAGLLMGLDDHVIDIFNRLSETVEGFRDGAFTVHTYAGEDYNTVKQSMSNGSRLVDLGEDGTMARLEGGMAEVSSGMDLVEKALQSWYMGAKGNASKAMERAEAQSGVSLKAEFQLDAKPLLTEIAQWLDTVETNTMWVVAQLAGQSPEQAVGIRVERDTSFQMEDEATRISRIVNDFTTSIDLPATLTEAVIMRWAESSDLIDMDAETQGPDGSTMTVRERLRQDAQALAEAKQRRAVERGDLMAGFGFDGGLPPDGIET